ncbi:MAG: hypothetical protein ACYTE0_12230 [Planctomycetota bacterium]|jgi:hypothetical protein
MTLIEAGVLSGIPIGGIVGGLLCKSFGILATIGGAALGVIAGGFLGVLYVVCVMFLAAAFSGLWDAARKHPNTEPSEEEVAYIDRVARFPVFVSLIGSTFIGLKEVWYNGLIFSGILAVFVAFYSVVVSKYRSSKNIIKNKD